MYTVADDMIRLEYIAEMKVAYYTSDDVEYLKKLLKSESGLISEGAEFTIFTSCKYLIAAVASEYQKCCMLEPISVDIPHDIRKLFYKYSRLLLPRCFNEYKQGDLELFIAKKLSLLYSGIIKEKLGITV